MNRTIKPASILNALFEEEKRLAEEENRKKMKKQKQIEEIKEKWKRKAKFGNKDKDDD